ncbi:hypothetical protein [Lentzea nigeriaca]|uniref:hypothetical protein n=1 Tax=Lentzea nigeriaca TaxID=1128665 RepID=UPI00195E829D|nr:hypothetical protein [Lentzea nigeriaca]MBM7863099.1 hypothetical protein [Lentzea nigeriaca]
MLPFATGGQSPRAYRLFVAHRVLDDPARVQHARPGAVLRLEQRRFGNVSENVRDGRRTPEELHARSEVVGLIIGVLQRAHEDLERIGAVGERELPP